MNNIDKDKEELLSELAALKQENASLKAKLEKEVTALNQTKDEPQRKEEMLLSIASGIIPGYIAFVNADTLQYEFVNVAYEKSFGIPREKIIGHSVKEIIGEANFQFALKYINEAKLGKSISYENLFNLADGKRWLQINYSPFFDAKKMVTSIVVFNYDITQQKLSEELLKEIQAKLLLAMDQSKVVYWEMDASTKIFTFNDKFYALYGTTAEQEGGYQMDRETYFKEFVPFDYQQIFPDDMVKLMSGEFDILSREHSIRRRDGEFRHIVARITVIKDGSGHVIGTRGSNQDITEHKMIEIELEKHRNNLEELVKTRTNELDVLNETLKIEIEKQKAYEIILKQSLEKEKEINFIRTNIISTVSHEFRTPLTSILSSTELIGRYSQQWNEDKKKEHVNRISKSISYLTKLLDNMLFINRQETEKMSFNPKLVNLNSIIKDCINNAESLISDHSIVCHYKSDQSDFILDNQLIKIVINNLLSNAIKFSPNDGKVELNIFTENDNLIIGVSDEGIGIPPEDIDKIFDSFYRAKNIGVVAGVGLGLAIVKRSVELHNGEITVNSELNKGTTFTVKIPLIVA
jgi:PAS domain S-box-containing protein